MSHLDATHVTRWSHINFDRPVPLVQRRDLAPGDKVMSSHGFAIYITEVHFEPGWTVVALKGTTHRPDGHPWNERYEGAMPLLERDDVVFGAPTYTPPWPEVPAVPDHDCEVS